MRRHLIPILEALRPGRMPEPRRARWSDAAPSRKPERDLSLGKHILTLAPSLNSPPTETQKGGRQLAHPTPICGKERPRPKFGWGAQRRLSLGRPPPCGRNGPERDMNAGIGRWRCPIRASVASQRGLSGLRPLPPIPHRRTPGSREMPTMALEESRVTTTTACERAQRRVEQRRRKSVLICAKFGCSNRVSRARPPSLPHLVPTAYTKLKFSSMLRGYPADRRA